MDSERRTSVPDRLNRGEYANLSALKARLDKGATCRKRLPVLIRDVRIEGYRYDAGSVRDEERIEAFTVANELTR